jgi:hypothetical protein
LAGRPSRIPPCPAGGNWPEHVRKTVRDGNLL